MLCANVVCERVLYSLQLEVEGYPPIEQVWLLRKVGVCLSLSLNYSLMLFFEFKLFGMLGILAWVVAVLLHHDYQRENNQLLRRIAHMNDEILQHQRYQEELWREVIEQQQRHEGCKDNVPQHIL